MLHWIRACACCEEARFRRMLSAAQSTFSEQVSVAQLGMFHPESRRTAARGQPTRQSGKCKRASRVCWSLDITTDRKTMSRDQLPRTGSGISIKSNVVHCTQRSMPRAGCKALILSRYLCRDVLPATKMVKQACAGATATAEMLKALVI